MGSGFRVEQCSEPMRLTLQPDSAPLEGGWEARPTMEAVGEGSPWKVQRGRISPVSDPSSRHDGKLSTCLPHHTPHTTHTLAFRHKTTYQYKIHPLGDPRTTTGSHGHRTYGSYISQNTPQEGREDPKEHHVHGVGRHSPCEGSPAWMQILAPRSAS